MDGGGWEPDESQRSFYALLRHKDFMLSIMKGLWRMDQR